MKKDLVVRRIFTWRVSERLGYQAIADRLNTDLPTNPPPLPVDPARSVGAGPPPTSGRC